MRIGHDQLVFRALVVLDEAIEASQVAPIKPSVGVRLALMSLYAVGRGARSHFDGFWHELQTPSLNGYSKDEGTMRAGRARSWLCGIARGVGVEMGGSR